MQERSDLSQTRITRDLTSIVLVTPRWLWGLMLLLGAVVAAGGIAFGLMVFRGLGVTGLNRPVYWAFFITNFVFWVGISHAGVMISAILRLTYAEWRRPVTRAAEILTIFSLATAAMMPVIHTGRPWRIYFTLPYDFVRGLWPNIRSPLIWDPAAITTYLLGSALFVYVMLVPDLAVLRDHTRGWRRSFYAVLSLGWRGNQRQWRLQAIAGILLAALILPVFISVHSIVSWDFAVSLVPGWHATIFAPYFVIGAVHSGVSAVVTLMAALRRMFNLKDYITPDHFDALGRLLLAVSTAWFYFFAMEFIFGLYSQEPQDIAVAEGRLFHWPNSLLFAIFLLAAYLIPAPLWIFRRVRRNIGLMLALSLLVNVGMWLERFLIIVPGLEFKQALDFTWGSYWPSVTEVTIVIATFAAVAGGILVFTRLFPIVPIVDQKEAQILAANLEMGEAKIPGVIRE